MARRACLVVSLTAFWLVILAFGFTQPAVSQTPSPEAVAAAKELVVTMRAADQLKTLFPMIMQQLKPAIVQGKPEAEKDFDAAVPQILALANERMSEFVDSIAGVYAQHFTADELHQLAAFYHTPVGQKFLADMPKIMQDSMAVGQKFGQSLAADMRDKMIDKLREKGHKI